MPINGKATSLLPGIGRTRHFIFHHLDSQDHAALSYFRDMRVVGEMRGCFSHVCRQLAIAIKNIVISKNIERGIRRRTGEWVAGVGMRMQERLLRGVFGIEGLIDIIGGEAHRQW